MRRVALVLSMVLSAMACRERISRVASASPASSHASSTAAGITLRRPNGSELAVIHRAGNNVEIRYAGAVLTGESRESGKRKYRSGNGPVMFEIKPNENGFKLRTAAGVLRWKVKISDDQIKISDNEENRNSFELKMKEGDRVKVVAPGERELGSVRGTTVEDANRNEVARADRGPSSAAYGVLLMDAIPEAERYILLAELLSHER